MNKGSLRLLALVFLLFSLAGAVGNGVGMLRGTKFMVVPGLFKSWGDILLFVLCVILLVRAEQWLERLLYISVGTVTVLGLLLASFPSIQSVMPDQGWWLTRLLLWSVASTMAFILLKRYMERDPSTT